MRGMPSCAKTYWTRPEQSKPVRGVAPPHWYRTPRYLVAIETTGLSSAAALRRPLSSKGVVVAGKFGGRWLYACFPCRSAFAPSRPPWGDEGVAVPRAAAANATAMTVPAGSESWRSSKRSTKGAVTRPTVAPRLRAPHRSMRTVSPESAVTPTPLTVSPVVVPRPSFACTLVAVTAPPNNDTPLSVTSSNRHREPPTVDDSKVRTEPEAG